MEVEYENRVHAETAPHPVCARLQRLVLNGRPELMTVQEVFSRSYKMLMKHKGMEKLLLDVPFNLCLLLVEKRPAFLIQVGSPLSFNGFRIIWYIVCVLA